MGRPRPHHLAEEEDAHCNKEKEHGIKYEVPMPAMEIMPRGIMQTDEENDGPKYNPRIPIQHHPDIRWNILQNK